MVGSSRDWAGWSGFWCRYSPCPPELSRLNAFGYLLLFVFGLLVGSKRDLGVRLGSGAFLLCSKVSLALALILCALRLGPVMLGMGLPQGLVWETLSDVDRNGAIRLVNFGLFAMGIAYLWRRVAPARASDRALRLVAYLGQHSLPVFVWSVLVTYVSMALMPPAASPTWRIADVLLCLGSLVIPARLDAVASTARRVKAELAIAPHPAQRRAA